jgi:hypothetical protein
MYTEDVQFKTRSAVSFLFGIALIVLRVQYRVITTNFSSRYMTEWAVNDLCYVIH